MEELFREALSLIESDVHWLEAAGQHCKNLANRLPEAEQAEWGLLKEVYRERATLHSELASRMREKAAG